MMKLIMSWRGLSVAGLPVMTLCLLVLEMTTLLCSLAWTEDLTREHRGVWSTTEYAKLVRRKTSGTVMMVRRMVRRRLSIPDMPRLVTRRTSPRSPQVTVGPLISITRSLLSAPFSQIFLQQLESHSHQAPALLCQYYDSTMLRLAAECIPMYFF